MPLWTTDYLNTLALEAEIEIAKEVPCIIERQSLNIEADVPEYELGAHINNIRQVIYKGKRLDPMSYGEIDKWMLSYSSIAHGAFEKKAFSKAFHIGGLSAGHPRATPQRYFYSKMGENVIRFHPSPIEAVGLYSNLYTTDIANAVIIEYYAIPDGVFRKIPDYIRRRTIKSYVLWKAFAKEGDGQNLTASEYHKARYLLALTKANRIIKQLYSGQTETREVPYWQDRKLPARPVLPWNYGITVEDDE